MKTKEFIEKVEALGYGVCGTYGNDIIRSTDERIYLLKDDQNLLFVDMTTSYFYDSRFHIFKHLTNEEKAVLMPIVFEFVATDPADREEEKRYRLRLDVPLLEEDRYIYLQMIDRVGYSLGSKTDSDMWQTIFTESEIAQMDTAGFWKEPVE
nr:hypothetical protein [uncultured Trichococcus sp.]